MTFASLRIEQRHTGARIAVHVQPRAARGEIVGVRGDALKVRVTAPPVDGAANAALVDVLAAALGVSRRCVRVGGGATSRSKIVEIVGVHVDNVRRLARAFGRR